jgi:hypothetical protein
MEENGSKGCFGQMKQFTVMTAERARSGADKRCRVNSHSAAQD